MGIKTILVAASGGTASGGAIDVACRLAQRFCAHLEGYHARLDIPGAAAALGEEAALGPTGMIVESMLAEGKATASKRGRCSTRSLPVMRLRSTSGRAPSTDGHRPLGARRPATLRSWSPDA